MSGLKLLRTAGSAAAIVLGAGITLKNNTNETPAMTRMRLMLKPLQAKAAAATAHPNADPLDPHAMNWTPSKWDWNWDRRGDPAKTEKAAKKSPKKTEGDAASESEDDKSEWKKPTATRHLLLIRHGQYHLDGKVDEEKKLTPLGREQATLTGKRLKELDLPWSHIIVSTMTRAKETKELICAELDLPDSVKMEQPDDILREGAPIRPEPDVVSWRPEGVYSTDGSRIEAAFRKYFHRADASQKKDSHELIVCHANVIRYFACRALQLPPEAWLRISLRHASVTWVCIRPDGSVSIRGLGDAGHFPPEMLTTS